MGLSHKLRRRNLCLHSNQGAEAGTPPVIPAVSPSLEHLGLGDSTRAWTCTETQEQIAQILEKIAQIQEQMAQILEKIAHILKKIAQIQEQMAQILEKIAQILVIVQWTGQNLIVVN